MLEKLKKVFTSQKQPYPSPQTQANIGNLAVHYVEELYTRIERLAEAGRIKEAKADSAALLGYLQKSIKHEKMQESLDTLPCSRSCKLAIEYLEKLFTLLDSLLEVSRIEEAKALTVYLDRVNKRRERFEKGFKRLLIQQGKEKK